MPQHQNPAHMSKSEKENGAPAHNGTTPGLDVASGLNRAVSPDSTKGPAETVKKFTIEAALKCLTRLPGDVYSVTRPTDVSLVTLFETLNAAARDRGMLPVFDSGQLMIWGMFEKGHLRSDELGEAGRCYKFKISKEHLWDNREDQIRKIGKPAPIGVVTLAAAIERLEGRFLADPDPNNLIPNERIIIRTATPSLFVSETPILSKGPQPIRVLHFPESLTGSKTQIAVLV